VSCGPLTTVSVRARPQEELLRKKQDYKKLQSDATQKLRKSVRGAGPTNSSSPENSKVTTAIPLSHSFPLTFVFVRAAVECCSDAAQSARSHVPPALCLFFLH